MSILNIPDDSNVDKAILGAVFLARLELRKLDVEAAQMEAADEWAANIAWFESQSDKRGSFLWFCTELGLEPDAVRRIISHG